ncbi:DUF883 family protein [Maritimibacter sp. HL-12]|uniref:glycine zipper domain-containing protein n=1 Tax=Maritimibacter sp. HL-12 TaxID=1162418 RepID=UPI000A0F2375|nr:DUF883 family protein [Maritimibacter sp. HL-12]SMH46825.1 Membrane-anchored ribosome-binding protein, inhibits growth in stationary phase, ElaB/YqjD/DUF883 family [Maritimibacter sp. HL-12]
MNATLKTNAKSSDDDLSQQIEDLREDLLKLAATVRNEMSDGIEEAGRQISKTGREAQTTATNAVIGHPLTAVGIAAGIGLLLGLLARKG